jgi:hypothetical protein
MTQSINALLVTGYPWKKAFGSPAPIAIHDDGNVVR